ncbi:MAG: Cof-type HAD-IIB family hydrolase [Solobacterium sp.]|nr:Cof-type HAD-IIB family hydrolase [Solobacterium sp.]
MTKMIFFDIDGTLTSFHTHTIPEEVFPALWKLKEQGIKLIIATGRYRDGLSVLKEFPFDGYITLNGQYCYTNNEVIYENTLKKESIEILLKELEAHPVPAGFQMKDKRVFNFRDERVDEIHAITGNDDTPAGDISEVTTAPLYQVMIFMNETEEAELLKKLPGCRSARWYPTFFDLSPEGGTKVIGMDQFCRYYQIPIEETMAFGDGGNDLEMIIHAGIGVVMDNGSNELKQHADYITSDADHHGIIQALRTYRLLK